MRSLHKPALSPRFHDGVLLAAVLLGGLGAFLPEAHPASAESLRGVGEELLPRALGCLVWGSVAGGLGVACVWAMLQGRRELASVPASVWALGVLVAQLMLALHCPLVSRTHLGSGHALIGAIVIAVLVLARGWQSRLAR